MVEKKSDVFERFDFKFKEYIFIMVYCVENIDSWENFIRFVEIFESFLMMVVYFIYLRIEGRFKRFGFWEWVVLIENFIFIKLFGYFDFLRLEKNVFVVMIDLGGV